MMASMRSSRGALHEGPGPRDFPIGTMAVVVLIGLASAGRSAASPWPESPSPAPSPSKTAPGALVGDEAHRVDSLDRAIGELEKEGQLVRAVAPAREVLAIRTRLQGAAHWETADARRRLETLTKVAAMPPETRAILTAAEQAAAPGDDPLD